MEPFYKRIADLRKEELASIKTILQNNNLSEINISEVSEPTHVFWFDNDGYIHEGKVLRVTLERERIKIKVSTDTIPISISEEGFALKHLDWLDSIRTNIIEALGARQNI